MAKLPVARIQRTVLWLFLITLVFGTGMFWWHAVQKAPKRALTNALMGRLPKPTEPGLMDSVLGALSQQQEQRPMRITHIPTISYSQKMPHPYVGPCINCHLIQGGAPAGSQFKTPYGAILEEISKNITKLGPPILPTSERPHPAAGRCIKCHDIVVHVPVNTQNSPYIWQ